LLKRIWKSIYRAPLENPTLIVDWCCGIGAWDMEMAAKFPQAKIVGVDYKEAKLSNLQHGLPNLEFKFFAIHDATTGLESFEDNSVDMIMMRDTWLINSPSFKWHNMLKESLRVLKPGGYIEVEEQGNCSTMFQLIISLIIPLSNEHDIKRPLYLKTV
jgi:ubiquinone/menaquinone biosynthesis C-methylase UbiE